MTKEERKKAIKVLDDMKVKIDIPKAAKTQNDRNWALDVAIQALSQEPCDDAISRNAVLDLLATRVPNPYYENVFRAVGELTPVTQKSETGHWINLEKKYKGQVLPFWGRYGCSKCGGYGEGTFNYCPNCGAKMESEDKE